MLAEQVIELCQKNHRDDDRPTLALDCGPHGAVVSIVGIFILSAVFVAVA